MRAYHLTSEKWGLQALRHRRLKLARLDDMNDPFELLGVALRTRADRADFRRLKAELNETIGLLCFSRTWSNPVLWSHYADKHRGICLGFDVPDEWTKRVSYQGKRLEADAKRQLGTASEDTLGYRLLTTKYRHWRYEDEVRMIIRLEHAATDGELHFLPFGPALQLREIVTGARCKLASAELRAIVASDDRAIKVVKGRLAFRSFSIVRNRAVK